MHNVGLSRGLPLHKTNKKKQQFKEGIMKRYMIVLVAIAIVIAMVGGAYAASISETVTVTGSVSGTCKAGTDGVMSFSIVDPSASGPILASVATDATVYCTKNTPFTVTASSANHVGGPASCGGSGITGTLKDASNNLMDYTFTCGTGAGTGQGFGAGKDQTLGLGGSISSTAYATAPASTYGDTITLTISY